MVARPTDACKFRDELNLNRDWRSRSATANLRVKFVWRARASARWTHSPLAHWRGSPRATAPRRRRRPALRRTDHHDLSVRDLGRLRAEPYARLAERDQA